MCFPHTYLQVHSHEKLLYEVCAICGIVKTKNPEGPYHSFRHLPEFPRRDAPSSPKS